MHTNTHIYECINQKKLNQKILLNRMINHADFLKKEQKTPTNVAHTHTHIFATLTNN